MAQSKCGKCVYRAEEHRSYRCNFAYLTGKTRLAEPPEKCTHFQEGPRLETPEDAGRYIQARKRRPGGGAKVKYDWEKGRELYDQKKNDREISREMGVSVGAVQAWRKREGLPANVKAGGNHGQDRTGQDRTGQDRTGQADEPVRKGKKAMKKETRDRIQLMFREDAAKKRCELDRVLIRGGDYKGPLEEYRQVLIAQDDFKRGGAETNVVG